MKTSTLPLKVMPNAGKANILLKAEHFSTPILDKLNEMAVQLIGMRLVIVYPTENGLEQVVIGSSDYMNKFCALVQSTDTGANHCRMCHLVMTKSSHADTPLVQHCHTGASALVRVVSGKQDSSLAVLSSCCFTDQNSVATWPIARRRGLALGLKEADLKKAYKEMVRLTPEKIKTARLIMDIAGDALKLVVDRVTAEAALEKERQSRNPGQAVATAVENALNLTASTLQETSNATEIPLPSSLGGTSVITIISDLVASKPYLPFTLRTAASSIQLTPNHFSYLFHKQHKICFSEFLTEHRLIYSKTLLKDLTLNIAQVAAKSGFHDAGYFARRFKQKTGLSPRDWRQKLERANNAGF